MNWEHHVLTTTITVRRGGWLGAWDSLVAAITRKPQFCVAEPVTLSFWAKGDPNFSVAQVQLEKNK